MGAWGTAISSNDTYADVHDEFFELYDEGLEVEAISIKLIAENQDTIQDEDDANNFWFALAHAQWECKQLNPEVFDRVKHIIESGADLEVWKQLDADQQDIRKRKIVLDKFLAILKTEKPKPRARKKKIIRQPVFEKGDCLVFKLANGNFSGAVVLETIRDTPFGENLIVSTRLNQSGMPTKQDFEKAEVLILNYPHWENIPNIRWYSSVQHKNLRHLLRSYSS